MSASAAIADPEIRTHCGIFLRARSIQRALDLASAVTTHLTACGLAPRPLTVLHEYASGPHGSARRSHDAAQRFHDEPS